MPRYDKERLPDAHGLVDIESSFSRLVGNKFAAVLDLTFLKLAVHVAFGASHLCHVAWSHSSVLLLYPSFSFFFLVAHILLHEGWHVSDSVAVV